MSSAAALVVLLLAAGLLLPLLLLLMRSAWSIVPYLYVNARVRAKEARLLKPEVMETMINAGSVAEIAAILENSDYAGAMQGLALEDSASIERVLVRQAADMFGEIARMLPGTVQKVFGLLIEQWDVRNIKVVLRGVRRGLPADEIIERLVPCGALDSALLRKMAESGSVEDALALCGQTPYAELCALSAAYEQGRSLLLIESALDKMLYELAWAQVSAERRLLGLKPFLAARIDALNYKILLRAKHDRLPYGQIAAYLIRGGEMPADMPGVFDEVDEIEALVTELEGTVFYKALIEVLPDYERDRTVYHFEKVLDETALQVGRHTAIKQPYGVAPILAYLTLKEAEVRNVRAVIWGKEAQMEPHEIREFVLRI